MDIKEVIAVVLNEVYLMSLATVDNDTPWSTILAFIGDKDFNIYWMSDPSSRHSHNLMVNNKASISITSTLKPEDPNVGVQIIGKVEEIQGDLPEMHSLYLQKKNDLLHTPRHEVQGFMEKWYKFTPEKFEVTYEPEWSFIKRIYIPTI